MGKRPIEDWLAQNLRVTLFPAETDWNINSAQVWWESAFGDQPDSRNLSPKLKNLEDEGAYAGGRVRLSVQRPRIDWLFTAPQVSPEEEPRWGIGPFVPSLDDFVGPIMKWLENAPPATRLAFGAVVILAVPDLQTGYLQLRPYLPCVTLDPEGTKLFLSN